MNNQDFSELMRQYQKLIYTVCLQFVRDPHTAEDLTQDTFLSAYTSIDRCDPAYYKQWLVRVAANKCKDHLKSAWARRVSAPGDDGMPQAPPPGAAAPPGPEDLTVTEDEAAAIRQMVRELKEPYLQVSVMYFLEERSVEEISRALRRPPKTVHTQLFRAKKMLREQIRERSERQ